MNFGRKSEVIRQISADNGHDEVLAALDECRANGWLEDGSLRGINLEGCDLSRARLPHADMQDAHLAGANLRGADLHNAVLQEADLSGADLSRANLQDADLTRSLLESVRMNEAQITEMQLVRVEALADAILPDGNRYDGRYRLPGDLHNARLDGAYPDRPQQMADWYGVSLFKYQQGQKWADEQLDSLQEVAAVAEEADVDWLAEARSGGKLEDGSLRGEDLSEINLSGCDLSRAVLAGVILDDAYFLRADLREADLSRASLVGADFEGANLMEAVLRGADLSAAELSRSNLQGADLRGADLLEASLIEANLQGAIVTDGQLVLVDALTGATLPDGCRYNGRFNLEGDLANAGETGIDINDAEQMALWYDIPLSDYQAGQNWARRNLPSLRPEEEEVY
ncbi:MAG: pentapeptide repeat-containing protein [Anaerolineae bacterium]|nr:pentapeptide repeat-containing protein [Anaerolineae bacterium]